MTTFHHCIINPKPHVNTSMVCKNTQEYLLWRRKNKNTMHALYSENPKILDRHPTKDLSIQKSF